MQLHGVSIVIMSMHTNNNNYNNNAKKIIE